MKSNFDFLNRYWPALAQIGATAETYVYSDPNACIYKLGMFAERLVQEILVFEHIAEPAVDNTHANRIRILKRAGLLPHEIDNTLYVLRKTRNSAVHIGTDSVDEAKTLLFFQEQHAKEAAEAVLEQIDLMKKSILARAFRGELGTNDPSEESAVELLKRTIL